MASLTVGDLVIPELLLDYMLAQSIYRSAFVGSAAAGIEDGLVSAGGGNTWTARRLAPYATRPVPNDGTTITASSHTPSANVAPISRRRVYLGMNATVKDALGAQNAALLQSLIAADQANIWPREMDQYCVDICKALFHTSSGCLRTTNSYSAIAAASGSADVTWTFGGYVAARLKQGDASDQVQAIVVHSKVEGDIDTQESQRCTFQAITGPDGLTTIAKYYAGKRLIVSDQVPTATVNGHTVYSSFLVGTAAFSIGIQAGPTAESGRLLSSDVDELLYKMSFGVGVPGCSWGGAPASADAGATSAEVQTAASWTKINDAKDIHIVEYRSN